MPLSRTRVRQVLSLSLPIMGGMLSQNILNLVDTAMVGRVGEGTEGTIAQAAVGYGSFANFLSIAFIMGLSVGVQAIAARRMGEGRPDVAAVPLNGGILLSILIGVPLSILLYWATPLFFPFFIDDPAVIAAGVPYLRARLIAAALVGVNFSFRGFWNGIKKSHIYMGTIVIMHMVNIGCNYAFIFGNWGAPELGAEGAGVASAISIACGSAIYFGMGLTQMRGFGFLSAWPSAEVLRGLIRLALPNGVQQVFFSGGMLAMFIILGLVGRDEAAAANIMITLLLFAYLPGMGLGMGAATLVGESLGRKDPGEAMNWSFDVARIGMMFLAFLGLPMVVFPELLLRIFTQDPNVITIALIPLRITGAVMFLEGVSLVLMHSLFGAGDNKRVMLAAVAYQWLFFLPAAFIIVQFLNGGLLAVWLANLAYRSLLGLTFFFLWKRGEWQSIKL